MADEVMIGILPDLQHRTGLLRYEHCTLAVTDRRLIIALATKEMRRVEGASVHERHRRMSPDALLAETPGNRGIPLAEVESARLERGDFGGDDNVSHPDRLILRTKGGKEVFTFGSCALPVAEAKDLLRQALGDRVR